MKTVVLHNIFVWYILFFRIHRWIESSKEQHLFEIETFWNIINVFTVTFDQFNVSLMNKSISFLKKKKNLTDPKFKNIAVYYYKYENINL